MSEIMVNAPSDKVFAAISDLTQHTNFAAHDLKIEPLEEGAVEVGKRYTSVHGTKTPDKLTITALVPNSMIAFHVEMPNGLQIDHSMTVGPSGDSTLVTRDQKIVGTPGIFKLMRPIISLGLGMATKKNLKNLKQWTESTEG